MKSIATRFALVTGLLVVVVACSPVTVIPHTGGMFTVTATAAEVKTAGKLVMTKSRDICERQDGVMKIIDQETVYQGIDKNQQRLVKFANDILPKSKTSGPYTPIDHEYKATVVFKCE